MKKYIVAFLLLISSPALADRYAVVDGSGNVVNIVEWDGSNNWSAPNGDTAVLVTGSQAAEVGGTYSNGNFSPATAPSVSPMQQAQAAALSGIAITSTATSSLNGTYPTDQATLNKLQEVALYIAVNGSFPAGQTSMPWADASGQVHAFPTTAEFSAFAKAVADYVAAIDIQITGLSAGTITTFTPPNTPTTIP